MATNMDKRGQQLGEQLLIFVFILMMLIVGGGIALGVNAFIGPELDFRMSEAELLNKQIMECIVDGKLDLSSSGINMDVIYNNCRLNKEVIQVNNLIKICKTFDNPDDCINVNEGDNLVVSTGGDFNACKITGGSKFVGCSFNNLIIDGIKYNFLTTSKQKIRRIQR